MRDYGPRADRTFIHRLKGSHSGHHHLMRGEGRALRAWLKVRGTFPGPPLSVQTETADRPHDAACLDEEVWRRGRNSGAPEALSCSQLTAKLSPKLQGMLPRRP